MYFKEKNPSQRLRSTIQQITFCRFIIHLTARYSSKKNTWYGTSIKLRLKINLIKTWVQFHFRTLDRKADNRKTKVLVTTKQKEFPQTKLRQKWFEFISYVENYRLQIFWVTLYSLVTVGIFVERAYCKCLYRVFSCTSYL